MTRVKFEEREFDLATNNDGSLFLYELTPNINLQALKRKGVWDVRTDDGGDYYHPEGDLKNFLNDICRRARRNDNVK